MIRIVAGLVAVVALSIAMLLVSADSATASACMEEAESLADGAFVRERGGNGDVWRIQVIEGKRFRFLVLNWDSLTAYGRDDNDINEIPRCIFAYLSRSWLGLLNSSYYYFHGVEDSDDGWVWKIEATSDELSNAGLDLDSIFTIEKVDYDQYRYAGIYPTNNLSNIQMVSTRNNLDTNVNSRLQATEIVISGITVSAKHDIQLKLHWGGGSLLHLKGRLATLGCIVDKIWIWDSGVWYPYSQYGVPRDQISNVRFRKRYTEFIPARTLYSTCVDACDTGSTTCISYDRMLDIKDNYIGPSGNIIYLGGSECTQAFSTLVYDRIFSVLPLRPDTCIVTIGGIDAERWPHAGLAPATPVNTQPFIVVFDGNLAHLTDEMNSVWKQHTEIHELCHQNQYWHWVQQRSPNDEVLPDIYLHFERSQGGRDLLLLTKINFANGRWHLPPDSVYREIYSKNPLELAAELCALYLLDATGRTSAYIYSRWDYDAQKFETRSEKIHPHEIDMTRYLTPRIRQWLIRYMILPPID